MKVIQVLLLILVINVSIVLSFNINNHINKLNLLKNNNQKLIISSIIAISITTSTSTLPSYSVDLGANDSANTKIKRGGASTLQKGIAKTITRGVNLDRSNFEGENLQGVAFQQSIVRDANFKNCNLYGASFFDATLDGSNFENADLTLANVELAQFKRAIFKNTVAKQMYVVGTTSFDEIATIENSDWTETELSKYQRKYLCGLNTAIGTNTITGADTRESLLCED